MSNVHLTIGVPHDIISRDNTGDFLCVLTPLPEATQERRYHQIVLGLFENGVACNPTSYLLHTINDFLSTIKIQCSQIFNVRKILQINQTIGCSGTKT